MNRGFVVFAIAFSLTPGLVGSCAARQINFAKHKTFSAGMSKPSYITAADLNGDGRPDLVVADGLNQLAVFIAKGNGNFHPPTIFTLSFYVAGSVVVGDFNGDKKPDIAVVGGDTQGNGLALLTGNGDGTFNPPQYFQTTLRGASIYGVVGDFNKDGNLDIYVGGNGSGELILGDGKGNFHDGQQQDASGFTVAAGDFNGDGNLDVASSEPFNNPWGTNEGVAVLLGNGDGTFQAPQVYHGFYEALGVAVVDLNHDNKLDLVGTDYNGASVLVFLGNGDGTFGSSTTTFCCNQPSSVAAADYDADGTVDLAVSNFGGNGVTVLPGKGDGTFLVPLNFTTGNKPTQVVNADFNHDGSPDMAVTNSGDGTISILLNAAGDFVRVHSSTNPSASGQSVTFTATVRGTVVRSPRPSGVVTFRDGSTVLGQADLSNGTASLTISTLAKGRHKISATYEGDNSFNPNESVVLTENVK